MPSLPTQLSSNPLGRGLFWKILGAIVGAVVAVFLIAPILTGALTIAGYILYAGVGAWGGYALTNAIIEDQ